MSVEDRVEAAKRVLGITEHTAFAKICGVSKQAVNGWIKLDSTPSEKAGKNFEKNTTMRGDWLRYGTGPMMQEGKSREEAENDLLQYLKQLTPEEREKEILHFYKFLSSNP